MQPHDQVNFGGLCFTCSVFLSRASRGFSLTSVVPFIAHSISSPLGTFHAKEPPEPPEPPSSAQNVPSSEEREETNVFTG